MVLRGERQRDRLAVRYHEASTDCARRNVPQRVAAPRAAFGEAELKPVAETEGGAGRDTGCTSGEPALPATYPNSH